MLITVNVGLERIRRMRRWIWGMWLLCLPIFGALGFVGRRLLPRAVVEPILIGFAVVSMVSWVVLILREGLARCPRCQKVYSIRWYVVSVPFAWRCLHCGLPLRPKPAAETD